MKNKGKVQTNEYQVNVLVSTTNSNNEHYHHSNRPVTILKVLSDEEILELWKQRTNINELELAKDWLKKQNNYATSNIEDEILEIDYSSIVNYKKI